MIAGKLTRPPLAGRHPITSEVKVLILAANPSPRLGDGSQGRPGALVEIGSRLGSGELDPNLRGRSAALSA